LPGPIRRVSAVQFLGFTPAPPQRRVNIEPALTKVSRLFGSSPEVWMRLQAAYDLKKAEQNKKVMERVARIVPVKPVEDVRA